MDALLNTTALSWPLNLKPGMEAVTFTTIADAALFIVKLPKDHDGRLHWTIAGAALESAHKRPDSAEALQHATLAMENALATERMLALNVSPEEDVSIHLGPSRISARSAVRMVMTEWSRERRDAAKANNEAVILRDGRPPMLGVVQIEELWGIPLSGIDRHRALTKKMIQEIDSALRRVEDGPGRAMQQDLSNRSPFEWIAGNFLADVYELNFGQPPSYSVTGPFIRFVESTLDVLQITRNGAPYSRSSISKARKDDEAGISRRNAATSRDDNYRFWRRALLLQAFESQGQNNKQ
jgi:hypothetical protein